MRSEPHIQLDQFLKLMNLVSSGGEAKWLVKEGSVLVNDQIETRRGRKLYPGDRVTVGGRTFTVGSQIS